MVLMGYPGALEICHYSHGTVRCLVQYIVFNVIHGTPSQNSSAFMGIPWQRKIIHTYLILFNFELGSDMDG